MYTTLLVYQCWWEQRSISAGFCETAIKCTQAAIFLCMLLPCLPPAGRGKQEWESGRAYRDDGRGKGRGQNWMERRRSRGRKTEGEILQYCSCQILSSITKGFTCPLLLFGCANDFTGTGSRRPIVMWEVYRCFPSEASSYTFFSGYSSMVALVWGRIVLGQ